MFGGNTGSEDNGGTSSLFDIVKLMHESLASVAAVHCM